MRRFEKEGRFWEISLEGQSVSTRSGTLTGRPRTSSKRYGSAKAALDEIDKRIAKRLAESGWIEVLPPFVGPVDLSPRIEGLDPVQVARRARAPGTGQVDGRAAAAAVTKRMRQSLERFVRGLVAGPPLPEPDAHHAVIRILERGPAWITGSLVQRSVLLAMAPDAETAELLVARFGIRAAVQAVAEGPRFRVVRDLRTAHLEPGEPSRASIRPAVARLRDLLQRSTDEEHAACEAMAMRALQHSEARDLELVSLFPAADWVDAYLLGKGLTADTLPVSSCAGPETFAELVRTRKRARSTSPDRLQAALEVVMQRHTDAAAPAVFALATALGASGVPLMARVRHPETVDRLVAMLDGELAPAARSALVAMSDLTLATLASRPVKAKAAEIARELVQQPGLVSELLPHLDEAAAKRLRSWVGDHEERPVADEVPAVLLREGASPLKPWIALPTMPRLRTPDGSHDYPPIALANALRQLSEHTAPLEDDAPDVGAEVAQALLDVCDPASLDEVLAATLTAWSQHEADAIYGESPWKQIQPEEGPPRWVRKRNAPETLPLPWVLRAVQLLGASASSGALFRCILSWSRKSARYPELLSDAVDVMCGLPGDDTLVHLGSLARRVTKAKVRIEMHLKRVAKQRGLDVQMLDEVLLPTLGLDERGRVPLHFGPRTFSGGFDTSLEPVLLDPDGTPRKSLPKAAASDDKALAKAAHATWRDLKKQVRTLRTTMMGRLEGALRQQRRWKGEHFLRYLAHHPLARHPVSALVWRTGKKTFRIDEAGKPVDVEDEPVELSKPVRLVHPIHLSATLEEAWREVLADYELIQPFEQLARHTYRTGGLSDLRGQKIPRGRLFALRNAGWVFRSADGALQSLTLSLQGLVVTLTPAMPVDLKHDEEMIVSGIRPFTGEWSDAPPVVVSEVARDLRRAIEWEEERDE